MDPAEFLEGCARTLEEHPSCSYLVPRAFGLSGRVSGADLGTRKRLGLVAFERFLHTLWASGTSAVSMRLSLPAQERFLTGLVAPILKDMAAWLNSAEPRDYLALQDEWEHQLNSYQEEVLDGPPTTDARAMRRPARPQEDGPRWRADLIKLIAEGEVLYDADTPRFLLKSGHRSRTFLNTEGFVSRKHSDPRDTDGTPRAFEAVLGDFLRDVRRTLLTAGEEREPVYLLPIKGFGETSGPVTLEGSFSRQGARAASIGPHVVMPTLEFPREPAVEEDEVAIPVEDVTTTGSGIRRMIEEYRDYYGEVPPAVIVLINRAPEEALEFAGTQVLSMLTFEDLVSSGLAVPEVLRSSLADEWWASLPHLFQRSTVDLASPLLPEEILSAGDARARFERLLTSRLEIEDAGGEVTWLAGTPLRTTPRHLVNYFTNLTILTWNALARDIQGSWFTAEADPAGFMLEIVHHEENQPFVSELWSRALARGFEEGWQETGWLDDDEQRLHLLVVSMTGWVLGQLEEAADEGPWHVVGGEPARRLPEQEVTARVEEAVQGGQAVLKRYGGDDIDPDEMQALLAMLRRDIEASLSLRIGRR